MTTIALISCSARKLGHPGPARDLYTGTLFRYARAWVEDNGWSWHILSAQYGLVEADQVLAPYDTRFQGSAPAPWVQRVYKALLDRYDEQPTHFKIFAGRAYRGQLMQQIQAHPDWITEAPLNGMGIGQQIAWLKDKVGLTLRARAVLSTIQVHPGQWTAWLCRHLNDVSQTEDGIIWCGLCSDYANPRKRARAQRYASTPTLPGLEPPYQLHEPCTNISLRQLQDVLRQLCKDHLVQSKRLSTIPDGRNHRGWDYATRWWPSYLATTEGDTIRERERTFEGESI